jgi:hypothetical protein
MYISGKISCSAFSREINKSINIWCFNLNLSKMEIRTVQVHASRLIPNTSNININTCMYCTDIGIDNNNLYLD